MNGKTVTPDDIATAIRMRRRGYMLTEIAKHMGRTLNGVRNILKGTQEPPSPAVYRMRRRVQVELRA